MGPGFPESKAVPGGFLPTVDGTYQLCRIEANSVNSFLSSAIKFESPSI
jgi:hypothetical protein